MKTEKVRLADVLQNPNYPRKDFAGIERNGFEQAEEEQDVIERLGAVIGQLREKAGENGK